MSNDDWEEYTKKINPIKSNKNTALLTEKPTLLLKNKPKIATEKLNINITKYNTPPKKQGQTLDKNTLAKLKSGDYPVSKTIDFHGSTLAEMEKTLSAVVVNCYETSKRCLLVITGKGKQTKYGGNAKLISERVDGVLKSALPNILTSGKLKPYVLAYCQAKQKDGGSGAFYVLLRDKSKANY